ncbi:MAG: hypothetical protein ACJA1B_002350 [Polaribacter sp.]|jgi:hypothetical protein
MIIPVKFINDFVAKQESKNIKNEISTQYKSQ